MSKPHRRMGALGLSGVPIKGSMWAWATILFAVSHLGLDPSFPESISIPLRIPAIPALNPIDLVMRLGGV